MIYAGIGLSLFLFIYLDIYQPQVAGSLGERGRTRTEFSIFVCASLALSLFAGSAFGLHSDQQNYLAFYEHNSSIAAGVKTSHFEYGFVALTLGFRTLGFSYYALDFVAVSFIVCTVAGFIWRFIKTPFVALFLFYCCAYMPLGFQVLRQALALAIFYYALKFVLEDQPWIAALLCLFAGLLHASAFALAPLVFFLGKKRTWKFYAIASSILLAVFVLRFDALKELLLNVNSLAPFLPESLRSKLSFYASSSLYGAPVKFSLNFVRVLALLGIGILFYEDLATDSRIFRVLFNLLFIHFFLMTCFNGTVIISGRFSFYFQFDYLLIPFFIKYFRSNWSRLLYSGLCLAYGALCAFTFFYVKGTGWVVDYRSWLLPWLSR